MASFLFSSPAAITGLTKRFGRFGRDDLGILRSYDLLRVQSASARMRRASAGGAYQLVDESAVLTGLSVAWRIAITIK